MVAFSNLYPLLKQEVQQGIEAGYFPSAVVGIRIGGDEPVVYAQGQELSAVFDLASLTKVMATLPVLLLAVQEGKAKLSDPIVRWVPEFACATDNRREQVTLYHLLTHTSGLPAWRPFFIRLQGREDYLAAISREPLVAEPGAQILYSDPGFMLLGFLIERIWNAPLEEVVTSRIIQPLGLTSTGYKPTAEGEQTIVPSEHGNGFEKNMAYEYADKLLLGEQPDGAFTITREEIDSFPWREDMICGTVHDCNAHYGLGGISGHAGLFSDMKDVLRYMDSWTSDELLSEEIRAAAVRQQVSIDSTTRGLGWVVYGADTFGHTGFTGTSVWHNTERAMTSVILTNRVHPYARTGIQDWRDRLRERLLGGSQPN